MQWRMGMCYVWSTCWWANHLLTTGRGRTEHHWDRKEFVWREWRGMFETKSCESFPDLGLEANCHDSIILASLSLHADLHLPSETKSSWPLNLSRVPWFQPATGYHHGASHPHKKTSPRVISERFQTQLQGEFLRSVSKAKLFTVMLCWVFIDVTSN